MFEMIVFCIGISIYFIVMIICLYKEIKENKKKGIKMPTNKKPKCRICNSILYILGTHAHDTVDKKGWYCKVCNVVYLNKGIKVRTDALFIGLKKIT